MVGNDKTGWRFISKEGRQEGAKSDSENNPSSGGPALPAKTGKFGTLAEFFGHSDFKEYQNAILIPIDPKQEATAIATMNNEAKSEYNIFVNNCGHAVNNTLTLLGISTFSPKSWSSGSIYNLARAAQPNDMYIDIKMANHKKIIMTITK
ncbi:MAG TPA: hypothetical protein VD993_11885 [Chitinophagaceae bacterium]|nr:hypothetical protein [Chitinophagaceae bacterium]